MGNQCALQCTHVECVGVEFAVTSTYTGSLSMCIHYDDVGFISGSHELLIGKFSEAVYSSRRQYRDYIINLYGVKHSTVSNSKCAIPSLSCLFYFYTIPISLIH